MKVLLIFFVSCAIAEECTKEPDNSRRVCRNLLSSTTAPALSTNAGFFGNEKEDVVTLYLIGPESSRSDILLNSEFFKSFPKLKELYVTGTKPVVFVADPVVKSRSLSVLNFTGNSDIQINIPDGTIVDNAMFPNLEELVLDRCGLRSVPLRIFDLSPRLSFLSLSGNELPALQQSSFRGSLKELIHLNISKNPAIFASNSTLPVWLLLLVPNLETLDVSETGLGNVHVKREEPHVLRELIIRNTKAFQLSSSHFDGLLNLTTLDLSGGDISQLRSRQFDGLNLRRLNLSGNSLTSLPYDAFTGSSVRDLDLSSQKSSFSGPIERDVLRSLKNSLVSLNMSDNPTLKLRKNFLYTSCVFPHLEVVRLRNTGMSDILEINIPAFPKLRTIDVSGNSNANSSTDQCGNGVERYQSISLSALFVISLCIASGFLG